MDKKTIRFTFRESVFERDHFQCLMCGYAPPLADFKAYPLPLDAHHISDRHNMPNGGYVKENGISVCGPCHLKAEQEHISGNPHPGYSRTELYAKIGSSYRLAVAASLLLDLSVAPADFWSKVDSIQEKEKELDESPSQASWLLACEALQESHPEIIRYGEHRIV